jgi:hypothetical protein
MKLYAKEISNKQDLKRFIKYPDILYSGNNFYIPPIHSVEYKKLSPFRNSSFESSQAKYWLAYLDDEIVGRVAGIINYSYNQKQKVNFARFGWLDFIDNHEVSRLLLRKVEEWAVKEGMSYIHGPLGFNSFDPSGVLVEGFSELPTSFAHYNFPYYSDHIEHWGYKKDIDWIEYRIKVPASVPLKVSKGAELIKKRYNLTQVRLKSKNEMKDYIEEMFQLLNECYDGLYGFSEITDRQIQQLTKQFLGFFNPEYISLIKDNAGQLIAFGIVMPSMSEALKKNNGKIFPFGFLTLTRALKKNDTIDLLLIGIKPEFQNKGLNAIIFNQIMPAVISKNFKWVETNRELENNKKVQQLWRMYDHRQHKRSRSYIKKL